MTKPNLVNRVFGRTSPKAQADEGTEIDNDVTPEAIEGVIEETADFRAEERARISAILTCDEAEGKRGSAEHLALKTNLSVEDAIAVLAGVEAPKVESGLDSAMAAVDTTIGEDVAENQEPKAQTLADRAVQKTTTPDKSLAGRIKQKGQG